MSAKRILEEIASNLLIEKVEMNVLKGEANKIISLLKDELRTQKISAEVFAGGSFAKETLVKEEFFDVDIFVRFDWKYEDISKLLDKVLDKIKRKSKLKLEKIHGSRDYFRIIKGKIVFEIVPVVKIKKPKEARNVTDLSYFHVNYVKRKAKKLTKEIVLAKQFCKSQKVYGAESYVNGFSGYALECLIIYYKSFEKMLKELARVRIGERVIIDPAKHYKKKGDVLFEMNESKLGSPIILIDPTWKERNALAALSRETFEKFQEDAKQFLKRPSKEFFVVKKFDVDSFKNKAKKKKAEFVKVELETNKQPGDIAGTKLKKFSNYLTRELARFFEIKDKEFDYNGENKAALYLIAKSKKEILKIGPPKTLEKNAREFKKQNKNIFEKNGILHAKVKINFSAKKFISDFAKKYHTSIKDMDIVWLEVK
jgi:tRNA nucleotidyltransferase (CCA-adding enzyme)